MADTSYWDQRRGVIRTRKGGWVIGKAIYNHGYSMMDDLVGKASWMQVLILNITGRLPERRLADWLDAAFVCMSWPDARIWCNQIGSLTGTLQGSAVAAVTAGVMATDSIMYGAGPLLEGSKFIREALIKKQNGCSAEEIIKEQQRHPDSVPMIVGYARPIATGDERVQALRRFAKLLDFATGEYLSLANEIEQILLEKFNEGMNIVGYVCAFLCDHGYSDQEIYRMCSTCVSSGVLACHAEAADQPPESFFPLHCTDIDYQGPPPRPVPEKK